MVIHANFNAAMGIDGEITLPRALRDALHLEPGDLVTFSEDADGKLIVERVRPGAPGAEPPGPFDGAQSTEEIMRELRGQDWGTESIHDRILRVDVEADGRLTLPAAVTERAGFSAGETIELHPVDGRVLVVRELRPTDAYGLFEGPASTEEWMRALRGDDEVLPAHGD